MPNMNLPSCGDERVLERSRPVRNAWKSNGRGGYLGLRSWWWGRSKMDTAEGSAGALDTNRVGRREREGNVKMIPSYLESIWEEEHPKRIGFWQWQGIWWVRRRVFVHIETSRGQLCSFIYLSRVRKRGVAQRWKSGCHVNGEYYWCCDKIGETGEEGLDQP